MKAYETAEVISRDSRFGMAATSAWGGVGWWIVVVLSVPFGVYASLFVYGDFNVFKNFTIRAADGDPSMGLNVLEHLRAWQIHAVAAEVFIMMAPFQFTSSFRKKYRVTHRWMGYLFVAATTVLIISAFTVLIPNTEFGPIGRDAFFVIAVVETFFLINAVRAAKQKNFEVHRKFMIRTAALGYSVMSMRQLPALFTLLGISLYWSAQMATVVGPLLFLCPAELYIQIVLSEKQRTKQPLLQPAEEPEAAN